MKTPPARAPWSIALLALTTAACSSTVSPGTDVGPALDAAAPDAGTLDSAALDSAALDGGVPADGAALDAPALDVVIPDRAPGQRAPLSAMCDPVDPLRCLLPWPSSVYTVVDPTTATGLRVAVDSAAVPAGDSPVSINRADGFSRVSPIVTAFPQRLDATTLGDGTQGAVRVYVAQPGATFAAAAPLRFNLAMGNGAAGIESTVVAYPRVPLAPATDYVVVVLDQLRASDGSALAPDPETLVALGLRPPATVQDVQEYAYQAPARAVLRQAAVDPAHVLRLWDFTTRSLAGPTVSLNAMRAGCFAALAGNTVAVAVDNVTSPGGTPIATIVLGRLTGVPNYVSAAGVLARDATGLPMVTGTHDVPFRVVVPSGAGSYPVVMYGHGTGGNVQDTSFDAEIAGAGAAKVAMQFAGWTDTTVLDTFNAFEFMLTGTDQSTAGLLQSLADGATIQRALATALGDALAAPTLGGAVNPAAGRRPDTTAPIWAGGSLGGTMGLVYSNAEPTIVAGVLNVPGAGWTQFLTFSNLFSAVRLIIQQTYHTELDIQLAVAMSQIGWDDIDGANWVDAMGARRPPFLLQESMGDPVLPNIGNELAATSVGAVQVAAVLAPVPPLATALEADARSGLTQYRVPSGTTAPLDIHGFAARDTPAGVAARQQIVAYIQSVWAGAPRITVPPGCVQNQPSGSCDFSGM